ncbi:unnamed protein product [Sphagnum balticum]
MCQITVRMHWTSHYAAVPTHFFVFFTGDSVKETWIFMEDKETRQRSPPYLKQQFFAQPIIVSAPTMQDQLHRHLKLLNT